MAFLTTSTGDGGTGRPILSYNAKAGRLFLLDRSQASDGAWHTTKTDVTMAQPAFALDFGRLEVGWLFFSKAAAPMMFLAPYGQPVPVRPQGPGGVNDDGKANTFKQGFRIHAVGQAIGGVRELAANSSATIEGLNALHTAYEAAPEAAADMLPLVRMTSVQAIKNGQSENYMPVFTIDRWVLRPTDLLGPRLVPCPTGGARTSQPPPLAAQTGAPAAAASRPAGHVEPPAANVAAAAQQSAPLEHQKQLEDAMPF